jgi:hypothetical protein
MRAYMWFDNTGKLRGTSRNLQTGWAGMNLADPASTNPLVQQTRAVYAADGLYNCVPYECPCPLSNQACQCAFRRLADTYWNGSSLQPKRQQQMVVDGVNVSDTGEVSKAAGSTMAFKLFDQGVPPGLQVVVRNYDGAPLLASSPQTLIFSGDFSTQVNLVVPPKSIRGRLVVEAVLTVQRSLGVYGF